MIDQDTPPLFEQVVSDLRGPGFSIIENALPEHIIEGLKHRIEQLDDSEFKSAGIGRQDDHVTNTSIRRDAILWLSNEQPQECQYLDYMSQMQSFLNRRLFLGLFSYESHFAIYQKGAFYKKHLDAFKGKANRVLTTVYYLNDQWEQSDGGELVIYNPENHDEELHRVTPKANTLVTFLSDEFPHEVLSANQKRYSIAGWFRINTSTQGHVDPPQ